MGLMTIQEFQNELNKRFPETDLDFPEFRLVEFDTPLANVSGCEKRLEMIFPPEFVEITTRYFFGELQIGQVSFGNHGEYYEQIADSNVDRPEQEDPWWEWSKDQRPGDLVYIAYGDPYAVIMNWRTGEVFAYIGGELWSESKVKVARGFRDFFLAVGTVGVKRKMGEGDLVLAKEVAEAVGGEEGFDFWRQMTY
ncbi:hypothetical protein Pan258_40460 [Symmachiella dynata]|uniref:hypothetical protein n=1 Tax=Symmachiella dynata TaxID=2527995 RepID=UPI00118B4FE9|nr:hypothetical protein [Symmachiella dynata]QDT49990.1 hypothetical protein Pan258_40460 [Symmachiella dynata]